MSFKYLYLARFLTKSRANKRWGFIKMAREGRILSLESFWDKSSVLRVLQDYPEVKIFLDSGAFTLATKKVEDIQGYLDDYIDFILKHRDRLLGYVNLDDVYDVEVSWKNQKYMEERGVCPIPVYHFREDFKWLEKYVNEYDYMGIGGVAPKSVSMKKLRMLLDRIFEYIYKKGLSVKVHGFGVFSIPFLLRFSWFSCDSTTWFQPSIYGKVFIPKYNIAKGKFDYSKPPSVVRVSELGLMQSSISSAAHYELEYSEGGEARTRIEEYFELAGVDKEELKVSDYEREKVNVYYFETFIKSLSGSKPVSSALESFFT